MEQPDDVIGKDTRPWPGERLWRSHPMPARGRGTVVIAVAALLTGSLLGYLAGYLGRGGGEPAPAAGATTAAAPAGLSSALGMTGERCAVQYGTTIELGIEVVNQSDGTLQLRGVRAILPLRGLRPVATGWGTCGALPPSAASATPLLRPGATGWLTMSFDVLVRCPGPVPVEFRVAYAESGHAATASLDEFPDLGQVRYTGCPAN
jgi:hypothetical protein